MKLDHILARPGETLTHHTLEVFSRIENLETLHPLPHFPYVYTRLRMAAWLHDSGKIAQGFQAQLRNRKRRWGLRHEVLSLAFLAWVPLEPEDMIWIAAIIATHHKDLSFILHTYRPQSGLTAQLLAEVDTETARQWYGWLAGEGVSLRDFTSLEEAAIRSILGELSVWHERFVYQQATPQEMQELFLMRGLFIQADHAAAAGEQLMDRVRINEALLPVYEERYAHQQRIPQIAGRSAILTAPAGVGKTDAALIWAAETAPPRLIFMLPYRVSMNAMLVRLNPVAEGIALQHGRALIFLYHQMMDGKLTSEAAA